MVALLGAINMQAVPGDLLRRIINSARLPHSAVTCHLLELKEQHEARIAALETEKEAMAQRKARLQSRLLDYKVAYDNTYRAQMSLHIRPYMLGSFRFDSQSLFTSGFKWKLICTLTSSQSVAASTASPLLSRGRPLRPGGSSIASRERSHPRYSLYISVNDTAFAAAWKVKAKVLLEVVVAAGEGSRELHVAQPRSFTHHFTSHDKERGVADMFDERALQKAILRLQSSEPSPAARAAAAQYLIDGQPVRITARASVIVIEANGAPVPLCDHEWPAQSCDTSTATAF